MLCLSVGIVMVSLSGVSGSVPLKRILCGGVVCLGVLSLALTLALSRRANASWVKDRLDLVPVAMVTA